MRSHRSNSLVQSQWVQQHARLRDMQETQRCLEQNLPHHPDSCLTPTHHTHTTHSTFKLCLEPACLSVAPPLPPWSGPREHPPPALTEQPLALAPVVCSQHGGWNGSFLKLESLGIHPFQYPLRALNLPSRAWRLFHGGTPGLP